MLEFTHAKEGGGPWVASASQIRAWHESAAYPAVFSTRVTLINIIKLVILRLCYGLNLPHPFNQRAVREPLGTMESRYKSEQDICVDCFKCIGFEFFEDTAFQYVFRKQKLGSKPMSLGRNQIAAL